ncbi:septum site-determining protein MinC [Paraburkholderia silvatlantica]|uniref:Probable septum site-determining protein MinC n=1 Tax=Paraburkholderia silvatlantica TaxID=321895 RepID=A0ABR6FTM3_9BURK|nr:septum site-determining protein MinC [Paraburkholderia silvatlantica]MBB2930135.1 septum site-determining protein MinC [Paraburkholderia silvatlantica]PVY22476.1 septum site-determining protein MinC [Paraburkholderia silvatlantica]PXW28945.1 septum site-determining protein MinC [Paraburkholderia silvatlantica]
MSPRKSPYFELKSGSVDTLLFVVKTTELDAMRAELTRRFEATPEFFANDTVAIDVRRLADGEQVALGDIARLLESVRMRPVGVVAQPEQHGWAAAAGLPFLEARDRRGAGAKPAAEDGASDGELSNASATASTAPQVTAAQPELFAAETDPAAAATSAAATVSAAATLDAGASGARAEPTLVIDRPLRSGQRIYAKGDVVVLGLVSNGAEVIAEGNIHIYAPLRGRALAGVHGNHDARIFCTSLEAELISIAGIYRTTEVPLADDVRGKPAQIRLEEEKLLIEPLRLT